MKKDSLEESVIVRISREDKEGIRRVSSHLALSQSEIMRRAIRLGLGALSSVDLPGAAVRLGKTGGEHAR
jgi:hypothetical protein